MESNKIAIVTAGSRGIGRAVVLKLLAGGFEVITCSRSKTKLEALHLDAARVAKNSALHSIPVDLSLKSGVDEFLHFANGISKEVDLLVNNAGGFVPGKLSDEPDGALEDMIDINLYSAYRVTRGILPAMIKRKTGHIFNMCSVASVTPYVSGGSYCIAKFALLGFSKVLREEMKDQGIRVTSILPGATFSDSWEGVDLPEERFMAADDIAATVLNTYNLSSRTVVEEIMLRPQLGDI
ncbi:MAG: oxidoreductase [Cyclobacteriaceae bacterium]|nr:MAG: oxidoreductase [Cyclobacteriaceae bacterium]